MIHFELNALVRSNILKMEKYASARDEFSGKATVFLDANENSIGSMSSRNLNRYPDPLQKQLRSAIAEEKNIRNAGQIFLGNGSDEAIDLFVRVFCEPRIDRIMLLPPTYGMYRVCAAINDVAVTEVPLKEDFMPDTEKILKAAEKTKPKIIFFCSPNNPSANLMDPAAVEAVLHGSNAIVIVDEAYVDFSGAPSWTRRLDEFPNLVVLQTFSKAWGMAGVRLGMAFASAEIISLLNKIKYPYNISDVTAEAVLKSLKRREEKEIMVRRIVEERNQLMKKISGLSIVEKLLPSDANFFMVRFANPEAVYARLRDNGVIVRNRSGLLNCRGYLRITVGTPEENDILYKALEAYAKEQS